MKNNSGFIEGIYNYCDRWCKRYSLTSKCFLYATEEKQFQNDESRDITNQKLWDSMEELFQLTFELLKETADDLNVNLDEVALNEEGETQKGKLAKNHPAAKLAQRYSRKVNKWLGISKKAIQREWKRVTISCKINGFELKGS